MPKLTNLSVQFISLVPVPANGKAIQLKGTVPAGTHPLTFRLDVSKADDERMMVYGIVYAPGEVDSQGDHADAETIRRAAYDFMRDGRAEQVDTDHSFVEAPAYVAETWLVRKGDPLFPGEPEGAWAVGIQVADPGLWRQVKAGEYAGLSLAGDAVRQPDPPSAPAQKGDEAPGWFTRFIENITKGKEMDESQVRGIVSDEITKALAKAGLGGGTSAPATPAAAPAVSEEVLTKAVSAAMDAAMEKLSKAVDDKVADALEKGAGEGGGDRPFSIEPTGFL